MAMVCAVSVIIVKLYLNDHFKYTCSCCSSLSWIYVIALFNDIIYFSPTGLDSDQESTLRSYVDPVSKFFEVVVLSSFLVN